MSPPVGTIDLGELPHGEQVERDAPWPVRQRLRQWRGRRHWQVAGTAVVVAITLITAGAAAPHRPAITFHFSVYAVNYEIDEENLYVIDDTGLTTYRLNGGAVSWRYSSPDIDESTWISDWYGGLYLLSPEEEGGMWFGEQTTRLDPATGRRLWTYDGSPIGQAGGLMLLSQPLDTEPPVDDEYTPPYRMTAIDAETGAPRWSREVPESWRYQVTEEEGGRLVTMSPDGRHLNSYDIRTGEPLASAEIEAREGSELQVLGQLVIVMSELETNPTWTSYDVDTLTPRWTVDPEGGLDAWPNMCGDVVCVGGRVPRAIDPATGATVWSADWVPVGNDGWFDVYSAGSGTLAGYLMLTSSDDDGLAQHHWLVDAGTGEQVLDMGVWDFPFYGYAMPLDTGDPLPIWSTVPPGEAGGGTVWVGRLRPDLSGVDPIGSIEMPNPDGMPYYQCTAWSRQLVCAVEAIRQEQVSGWEVMVWRLR